MYRYSISAVWFLAIVAGCGSSTSPKSNPAIATKLATTTLIVAESDGLRIDCPAVWLSGKSAVSESKGSKDLELATGGGGNISIGVKLTDGNNDSEHMKDSIDYLRGIVRGPNGTVDCDHVLKLDDAPAWKIGSTRPPGDGGGVTKIACWVAFRGDVMFFLTYEASEKTYVKNLPAIEQMVGSLHWIKPPTSAATPAGGKPV